LHRHHKTVPIVTADGRLNPPQQRAWLSSMRVYHRMEYEMNRQLRSECGMSLGDYTVMNALTNAPRRRAQLSSLATAIGWERSRLSHHLQRMSGRGFIDRVPSEIDGRATDAVLTSTGWRAFRAGAPRHAAWVKRLFFSELNRDQVTALADVLTGVYETILRNGTLPRPDIDVAAAP
jgi:DNA-binding MarR family transcriptional regulator